MFENCLRYVENIDEILNCKVILIFGVKFFWFIDLWWGIVKKSEKKKWLCIKNKLCRMVLNGWGMLKGNYVNRLSLIY